VTNNPFSLGTSAQWPSCSLRRLRPPAKRAEMRHRCRFHCTTERQQVQCSDAMCTRRSRPSLQASASAERKVTNVGVGLQTETPEQLLAVPTPGVGGECFPRCMHRPAWTRELRRDATLQQRAVHTLTAGRDMDARRRRGPTERAGWVNDGAKKLSTRAAIGAR